MPSSRLLVVLSAALLAVLSTYYTWIAAIKATTLQDANCAVKRRIADGRCAGKDQPDPALAASAALQSMVLPHIGAMVLGNEHHSDNCVFFARDRVPTLPYGLGSWKGKLAIVNAHDARTGDVAMIRVGSGLYRDVGHVAIVEEVTETSLTILEANYYAGRVSRRTATAANVNDAATALGISGYFRP